MKLVAERSAEAPASTDAANLKLQGQSLALTPDASSGWFGDVFISSKISGQLSPNFNREPREIHEKKSAYSAWSAVKKSVLQLNLRSRRTPKLSHRRRKREQRQIPRS